MKEVTATDAARQFSALLTAVETNDETFVITRGGKVIARIEPAGGTSGAAVKALLRHYPADDEWLEQLREMRDGAAVQDRAWRV